ncbi:MAG: hypothetical protein SFV54_13490 [Bryobacteraceae bacterium]|nr:hypothetical protein [Bryobacteraceae bacterium]
MLHPVEVSVVQFALLLATITVVGCNQNAATSSVPRQWVYHPESLVMLRQVLSFDQPGSTRFVISGVHDGDPGSAQRWTDRRAVLRFWPTQSKDLKLRARFLLPDVTLRDTGPVVVTLAVNQRTLFRRRYTEAGSYDVVAPVPRGAVSVDRPLIVELAVEPPWISPSDQTTLGVLLHEVSIM